MAVDNSLMIRGIITRESMIAAYCAYTNMPYVICNPDTYDDEVYIFETKELLQDFAKKQAEDKILLRGVQFMNKDFLKFYSSLFTMGVNMLVFVNATGEFRIALNKLVREPDFSKMKVKPVVNPSLVLTGMYYIQEARRPVSKEEKDLKELNEEFVNDLAKSRLLVSVILKEGEETDIEKLKNNQYQLPILKDKSGNVMFPVFTDGNELQRFTRGDKKFKALAMPLAALEKIIPPTCSGFILNPVGFNFPLKKELIAAIVKEYSQTPDASEAIDPAADHIIEDDDQGGSR